jgi:hypothetical protein
MQAQLIFNFVIWRAGTPYSQTLGAIINNDSNEQSGHI